MASIQVIQGQDKGKAFKLVDGENIIGRGNGLVELTDGAISRTHARVFVEDDQWLLEDMGSSNGTFLNGKRVVSAEPIKRGDHIRCGSSVLVFGSSRTAKSSIRVDEDGQFLDAAIVARVPSNEDSIILPTRENEDRAIGNLKFLYDLISDVSSLFNVDVLLQRTLDRVFENVKADRGYILLMNPDGKLVLKASRTNEEALDRTVPISRTIINEVISRQEGILCSNAMADKRFTSGRSVHDLGIHSAVCVPIKGHGKIIGILHIDCGVARHTYTTEQLRLLTAVGFQTGLAVENARMYEAAIQTERLAAVGETVAALSHHIKNILQALSAGIDVVELGLKQDNLARAKDNWPIVQRNLGRINDLILNMLAYSKHREPLLQKISLPEIITECVELVGPQAAQRGVKITADMGEIPPIHGDPSGMNQAFLNLISNALDAVEDNVGTITITGKYDGEHRRVSIAVADNGKGIPQDEMGKIFAPFYSSKGQGGTGLGLAVAKKVCQEHHGDIEVASKEGEGTTFTVTLPSKPPKASDTSLTTKTK